MMIRDLFVEDAIINDQPLVGTEIESPADADVVADFSSIPTNILATSSFDNDGEEDMEEGKKDEMLTLFETDVTHFTHSVPVVSSLVLPISLADFIAVIVDHPDSDAYKRFEESLKGFQVTLSDWRHFGTPPPSTAPFPSSSTSLSVNQEAAQFSSVSSISSFSDLDLHTNSPPGRGVKGGGGGGADIGDTNMNGPRQRDMAFAMPIDLPGLHTFTRGLKRQAVNIYHTAAGGGAGTAVGAIMTSDTHFLDVPGGDCFHIEDTVVVTAIDGYNGSGVDDDYYNFVRQQFVRVDVTFDVVVTKPTMLKYVIQKSVKGEMGKWLKLFSEDIQRIVNAHSTDIQQRRQPDNIAVAVGVDGSCTVCTTTAPAELHQLSRATSSSSNSNQPASRDNNHVPASDVSVDPNLTSSVSTATTTTAPAPTPKMNVDTRKTTSWFSRMKSKHNLRVEAFLSRVKASLSLLAHPPGDYLMDDWISASSSVTSSGTYRKHHDPLPHFLHKVASVTAVFLAARSHHVNVQMMI
eukprot:CAMPEP_0174965866 /NCGR_PEP_ID=MMETSP0004_2-20121128/6668_1 /TAXON_ID=420556 /ORGANISM="Ochromonas sp., Strain CCMP1393" /LENGTH=519 /DNA_ID=CAMNT_0016214739 /DNA_START=269 /DNA_END=1828 /DNA_ORIENTATION=-